MSPIVFPKMFWSEREGWSEVARLHPSVHRMLAYFVTPMSLLPPLMRAYAEVVHPGEIFPLARPAWTAGDLFINGLAFFAAEIIMVFFMAMVIRQIAEARGVRAAYADTFTLAAIAPAPLWLATLGLFVPSAAFNVLLLLLGWAGSVALIRHGVRPLLHMEDSLAAHQLASRIIVSGIGAWLMLMLIAAGLLSLLAVWRI